MRLSPTTLTAATVAGVAALVLASCGTTTQTGAAPGTGASTASSTPSAASPSPASGAPASSSAAVPAGAYLTRAEFAEQAGSRTGTKVVYFFHASWCPTCRATEQAIARDGIPAGLTVVKVDYDDETDLRKEYGVTTQHTFVQVDPSGAELAKWTGSEDGDAILAKTV